MRFLEVGFSGGPDEPRLTLIKLLAYDAMRIAGDEYGVAKAMAVIQWSAIACSPERHQPWGLPNVERFALENASRLHRHLVGLGRRGEGA